MAKLVSQPRPIKVEQPILDENNAPSPGVTLTGWIIIGVLVLGAVLVVMKAFAA